MINKVIVIGGGLAGSEACYQLAKRGISVDLYEMKPVKFSPAHHNANLAELVCSNSLKSDQVTTSSGLLKQELLALDSLIVKTAYDCRVPAGGALAVDREKFAQAITDKIRSFENVNIINQEVVDIPKDVPVIIATGPLTSQGLIESLHELLGQDYMYFFDASSPIVTFDSIDKNYSFVADRYDKGDGDYINCPMNEQEYFDFYNQLITAQSVELKDFENKKVFEGCMPVEVMAKRGKDTLRFGPLKPVGLVNPHTGTKPYAVVQLRKEDAVGTLYNLVGFQTNLTYPEQKRVFSMIPALHKANFVRYGVMHRNSYINAPKLLSNTFALKEHPNIYIAGQLSGVEGYMESTASGLIAALNVYQKLNKKNCINLSPNTMIGAIINYITNASPVNFQPMNSNYGIINALDIKIKDDKQKKQMIFERSMQELSQVIKNELGE